MAHGRKRSARAGKAWGSGLEPLEARRVMAAFPVAGDVGPQTTVEIGQSAELFLDIDVAGDEDYVGAYEVIFYLSTDDELGEPEDVVLAEISRNGTIPLVGGVRVSETVEIPSVAPGAYKLLATVQSLLGFANTGTETPILTVSTDFKTSGLQVDPQRIDLETGQAVDWTATLFNIGQGRGFAGLRAYLSADRKIGNADDIPLGGDGTEGFDLLAGAATSTSLRQGLIDADTPSGTYYFGLMVGNAEDPTPGNNIKVTPDPVVSVIGDSATDGVITALGGGQLTKILTHQVKAIRSNGTGFGAVVEPGGAKTATYAIQNTGAAPLEIERVRVGGLHPGDFALNTTFPGSLGSGELFTFTVTFNPTEYGRRRANLLFETSDPIRGEFQMRIAGNGDAPATAPDIEVTGSAPNSSDIREIANNDRTPEALDGTDFGRLPPGVSGENHIFQIRNAGQSDLVFLVSPDPEISIRAHSGEAANSFLFGRNNATTQGHLNGIPQTLRPGETMNFRIKYAPGAFGNHKPWVEIYTNDPDEALFRFKIAGIASPI